MKFEKELKKIAAYIQSQRTDPSLACLDMMFANNNFFNDGLKNELVRTFFDKIGEDYNRTKEDYFPSIRYHLCSFSAYVLNNSYHKRRGIFLDIGSCNGEKVYITSKCFENAWGIEVSKKSFDIAKKTLSKYKNIKLFNQDAFDSADIIKQADFIYTYCPIRKVELMAKLALFIVSNLKVDAQYLEVYPMYINCLLNYLKFDKDRGDRGDITRISFSKFSYSQNPIQDIRMDLYQDGWYSYWIKQYDVESILSNLK